MTTSDAARSYYSLNPGLFTSDESWSYRDLQQLCVSLGINASGKRQALEQRLQEVHRAGRRGRAHGSGLFHDEEVNVLSPTKKISPRLLSPLVRTPLSRSTENFLAHQAPSSILRRESSYGENGTPRGKISSLRFSPFNRVHVIPPKEESENFGHYREPDPYQDYAVEGDDSSSESSEEVWMNDGL